MICVSEKKAVICKGDFHPAQFYKGDKKITGYTVESFENENGVTLENCYNDRVYDAVVHGKNLLDVNKWFSKYVNGEGGITYKETDLANINYNCCVEYSYWKQNTSYTFSCDYEITNADNNTVYAIFIYTDGTTDARWGCLGGITTGSKSGKCTITSYSWKTVKSFHLSYSTSTKTISVKLTNMQIEEGATATEYEPPCRNATITARGKNLFNIYAEREVLKGKLPNDSYVVENGVMSFKSKYYDTSSTAFGLKVQVKKNTKYSFRYKTLTGRAYIRCFTSNGVQIQQSNSLTNFSFNSGDNECLYFSFASNVWETYTELTEMIIIESGEDNTFEPYTGYQTIPFENDTLMADIPTFRGTTVIEVESDVPATISGKYKKVEEI